MTADPMTYSKRTYKIEVSGSDWSNMDRMQCFVMEVIGGLLNLEYESRVNKKEPQLKMTIFWKSLQHIANISLNGHKDSYTISFFRDNFPDNTKDTDGKSWLPLHCAAMCPNIDVNEIQALSTSLIGENRKDGQWQDSKRTMRAPYHLAAAVETPNIEVIHCLERFCPRMAFTACANGMLPLHYAAKYSNSVALVEELLQANPAAALSRSKLKYGDFPIRYAYDNECSASIDMMRTIIKACPDCIKNQNGRPIFSDICCTGTIKMEKLLLVLVECPESFSCTPFHFINSQSEDVNKLILKMLELNPDLAQVLDKWDHTPLHCALRCSDEEGSAFKVFNMLLKLYPNAVRIRDIYGRLPLHYAGSIVVVKALIQLYPEGLNIADEDEDTPLFVASDDVLKYLCTTYPDCLNYRKSDGSNIFHKVISDGYLEINTLKLLHRFFPSGLIEVDNQGNTPLHILMQLWDDKGFHNIDIESDVILKLIRLCPEAVTYINTNGHSPYDMFQIELQQFDSNYGQSNSNDDFKAVMDRFHRCFLQTVPHLNRNKLLKYNYNARRMALFMFYSAVHREGKDTIFSLLRRSTVPQTILTHIVQYL